MLSLFLKLIDDPDFCKEVQYKFVKWNRNDYIFREGIIYPNVSIIKSGLVSISVNGHLEGKTVVHPGIIELGAGDIFGMFGFIDGAPAGADAMALEDTEAIEIDNATFSKYLDIHHDVGYQITKNLLEKMVARLRKADRSIAQLYAHCLQVHEIDKYLE